MKSPTNGNEYLRTVPNTPSYSEKGAVWIMGTYLNPGNSGFTEVLKSDYVDKIGLINLINSTIGTKK